VYTVFLVPRSEVAEREQVLRTRAMREREEMRAVVRHYRYTLLRVRMPDGLLLQGKVSSCRQFMMPLITKYLYHSLNGTLVRLSLLFPPFSSLHSPFSPLYSYLLFFLQSSHSHYMLCVDKVGFHRTLVNIDYTF